MTEFSPPKPLKTAVLFLVFNRPEPTARVFNEIRQAQPPRLYIAADGPPAGREGERELSEEVRRIATTIDWDCDVITLFREENLGCRRAVSGAIDWFFEHEECGIILEDDCLPSQSFFWFCDEMLDRYRDDTRIGQVSGLMRFPETLEPSASYSFSRFGDCWGWASWRRAWKHFHVQPTEEVLKNLDGILRNVTFSPAQLARRKHIVEAVSQGDPNIWDYQWGLTKYAQSMLSVVPPQTLIENIGLDSGTHQTDSPENRALRRKELSFPIQHTDLVFTNTRHDQKYGGRMEPPRFSTRVRSKLRRLCASALPSVMD